LHDKTSPAAAAAAAVAGTICASHGNAATMHGSFSSLFNGPLIASMPRLVLLYDNVNNTPTFSPFSCSRTGRFYGFMNAESHLNERVFSALPPEFGETRGMLKTQDRTAADVRYNERSDKQ